MSAPKPATAFNDLVDRLQVYFDAPVHPTNFELAALARDAKALLKTDQPVHGWVALTAIASLEWDAPKLRQIAERAATAIGRSAFLFGNVAVSFRNMHCIEDALEFARMAYQADPTEWKSVEGLTSDLSALGRFDEAAALAAEYVDRLGTQADSNPEARQVANFLTGIAKGFSKSGCTGADVAEQVSIALQVLTEAKHRSYENVYRLEEQPEGGVLFQVDLMIQGTFEDELRFGAALAPRLAELRSWDPNRLLIDYKSKAAAGSLVKRAHAHLAS
jgi:hypothetical protein